MPYRQKKKKVVEELSDDSDHGDFDAQQVREHEEFTKVRSRAAVQHGQDLYLYLCRSLSGSLRGASIGALLDP